ncbi:transcriptional regulator [Sorangium cellulosum]|uniref:Transcriptional regulator n=1 Tax=Sorangium cellulosum TaxID=56 RepID=A0A150PAG3_SORCE|nr:transcriptional regulator [Sorangium cellulosum]
MPRPRSLSHPGIAAAALAVIDREGLAALSMRAVASELGMSTMALYRYVNDREQLERLVVDLVLSAVDVDVPARGSWSERVTILVERMRDAIRAHPSVVPLTLAHRHSSEGVRRFGEALLAVLTEAGFAGAQRVIAFRSLLSYVIGALQAEHLGPLSGAGTARLAELSEADYPFLSATARDARHVPPDQEFFGGLAILLRGLHADRHHSDC